MKHGIDISRWNGDIDIKSVSPDFVIIKAGGSDDGLYIDSRFLDNYIKCKNAGIPCGIYWYTKAHNTFELNNEINYLLSNIEGLQFELPIFLDIEEIDIYDSSLSLATEWLNTLPQYNFYPAIYTSYSWWIDKLRNLSCDDIQKWVALWGNYDDCGIKCGVWQTGAVDNIDRNIMYADYSFIKEKGLNGFNKKIYFSDVTAYKPYYEAIENLADMGIVKGYKDGTFKPENSCKRGELCIILWRIIKKFLIR